MVNINTRDPKKINSRTTRTTTSKTTTQEQELKLEIKMSDNKKKISNTNGKTSTSSSSEKSVIVPKVGNSGIKKPKVQQLKSENKFQIIKNETPDTKKLDFFQRRMTSMTAYFLFKPEDYDSIEKEFIKRLVNANLNSTEKKNAIINIVRQINSNNLYYLNNPDTNNIKQNSKSKNENSSSEEESSESELSEEEQNSKSKNKKVKNEEEEKKKIFSTFEYYSNKALIDTILKVILSQNFNEKVFIDNWEEICNFFVWLDTYFKLIVTKDDDWKLVEKFKFPKIPELFFNDEWKKNKEQYKIKILEFFFAGNKEIKPLYDNLIIKYPIAFKNLTISEDSLELLFNGLNEIEGNIEFAFQKFILDLKLESHKFKWSYFNPFFQMLILLRLTNYYPDSFRVQMDSFNFVLQCGIFIYEKLGLAPWNIPEPKNIKLNNDNNFIEIIQELNIWDDKLMESVYDAIFANTKYEPEFKEIIITSSVSNDGNMNILKTVVNLVTAEVFHNICKKDRLENSNKYTLFTKDLNSLYSKLNE